MDSYLQHCSRLYFYFAARRFISRSLQLYGLSYQPILSRFPDFGRATQLIQLFSTTLTHFMR
ncbi:unnamed protein product [Haemonchus placei]|uniref:Uncharacterized protein n=1 Tax=Haemonchus placei TaxID=6290 RepID=A0A3P7UY48_HAEPC|nr:unnamed protein product [Haemonchus placei]